ncbi:MAG TPA: hypothetical protein VNN80_30375 [Polyangiaceae bacterium]|nr:hypothetical protein [Polyangiaceae bacterium]
MGLGFDVAMNGMLTDMAAQSWIELMADYGVALGVAADGWEARAEDSKLFGVIGFGGKGVRATCLIGAERSLVDASCRARGRSRDWIAELANQLVGRLKMKLLGHGVSVTMTTPLALSGVRVTPLPRFGEDPVVFGSDQGAALLWLEIETDDQFVLSPARPLSVGPGDLIF